MSNYFNKYNVINFTIFISLIFFIFERLATFFIFQTHLETFFNFIVFISVLRLIASLSFLLLLFIINIDFAFRNAEFDYFRNSIKSYVATWQMRRFCRQINVEPSLEESSRYSNSKQEIIRKANRSLLTLTVIYYKDRAVAKWTFPANCESYNIMEELLAQAKRELNQLDSNYLFNDFIRLENSRTFISTAFRKK
ncbi:MULTISPECIES: hypothetical protein [Streptococcus]|jgi:hypothetical protein|uniref:Uncharacterized protein n=3 Tax=Streptococcus TaxID=1301 RepID=A0A501P8S6_9STRE|nr:MULTISPECIES: hypothetical protein [Streptococcus]KXU10496.1 hypothetical protein SMIDD22_02010 [Streptococcus mitis]KXU13314.1 hypothetical protein SORDD17_01769 [Streptococcus oralis]RRD33202.1 hypothetical protein EII37_07125 [Streptococcus sp. OH4692_COT-348]TPD56511.1 hypothetical protein FJN11_09380 [Streptococcus symci]